MSDLNRRVLIAKRLLDIPNVPNRDLVNDPEATLCAPEIQRPAAANEEE